MRWPFRRTGADAGVDAGADVPAPAAVPSAPAGEWRKLPALQRVSADLAPVAPLDRFADSLPTHQDPRFLAPLAHALTPDAPTGEVTGLAEPVKADGHSVREFGQPQQARGDVPVQRHQAEPVSTPAAAPVQRATPVTPVPAGPSGQSALPAVEPRPIPTLPGVVVSRAAADPEPPTGDAAGPSAPLIAGGDDASPLAGGTSNEAGAGDSPPVSDAPTVSRSVVGAGSMTGPGTRSPSTSRPSTVPAGNSSAGERAVAAGSSGDLPVVSRTVQTEAAGTPRAMTPDSQGASPAQNLPALPPVRPAAGTSLPSGGEFGGESGGAPVAGSADPGDSGVVSEIAIAATPADVVQRTTGGSAPGAPSEPTAPVRPETPAAPLSMPPLPVVSRSTAPAGSSDAPSGSSNASAGSPSTPAGTFGTSDGAADIGGQGAGYTGQAPLIGSAGLSPLVAALGGTDEPPDLPGSTTGGHYGDSTPTVARLTGRPDSGVPTVARTTAGPGGVPTAAPTTVPADSGAPSAARMAHHSGGGMPVVARTMSGHGGDPQLSVAEGNQSGPAVQRTFDSAPLPVAPARLMWPPAPAAPQPQTPLTSERPLTVPHDTSEYAETPPPVQRVSFDAPTAPQVKPAAPLRSAPESPEGVAPVPELPVMRTADPTPGREVVRALPLQRMFGDLTTVGSSEPVQEMRWQPPVQREDIATSPATSPAAEPAPAPEPPAPAPDVRAVSAAAPPAAASATDLDEMAKRLYEPLTARLRAELWLDRERAGLVTDRRY